MAGSITTLKILVLTIYAVYLDVKNKTQFAILFVGHRNHCSSLFQIQISMMFAIF